MPALLGLSAQRLSAVAASLPPLALAVLLPLLLDLIPQALTEALAALTPGCVLRAAQGEGEGQGSMEARRALCSCEASALEGTSFIRAAQRWVHCSWRGIGVVLAIDKQ